MPICFKRCFYRVLEAAGKTIWTPSANEAAAFRPKCRKWKARRGDFLQQTGQRLGVTGIEREPIDAFLDQILRAATTIGNEDRQAGRHRFVHDQAPLFSRACVNKGARKPKIGWQFVILLESGQMH